MLHQSRSFTKLKENSQFPPSQPLHFINFTKIPKFQSQTSLKHMCDFHSFATLNPWNLSSWHSYQRMETPPWQQHQNPIYWKPCVSYEKKMICLLDVQNKNHMFLLPITTILHYRIRFISSRKSLPVGLFSHNKNPTTVWQSSHTLTNIEKVWKWKDNLFVLIWIHVEKINEETRW